MANEQTSRTANYTILTDCENDRRKQQTFTMPSTILTNCDDTKTFTIGKNNKSSRQVDNLDCDRSNKSGKQQYHTITETSNSLSGSLDQMPNVGNREKICAKLVLSDLHESGRTESFYRRKRASEFYWVYCEILRIRYFRVNISFKFIRLYIVSLYRSSSKDNHVPVCFFTRSSFNCQRSCW